MHSKQSGRYGGVLLVYTVATSLNFVGDCRPPTKPSPDSSIQPDVSGAAPANHRDGWRTWRTKLLAHDWDDGPVGRSHQRGSKQSLVAERFRPFGGNVGSHPKKPAPPPTFEPRLRLSGGKSGQVRDRARAVARPIFNPHNKECNPGKIYNGKFYIAGHIGTSRPTLGYQSDASQVKTRDQVGPNPEESWRRLEPLVECGDEAMTLTVKRRRAAPLLLHQVNGSAFSLSQLPSECGYSVQRARGDLSVRAPYDACHITQEDGSYVLPLLWRGIPVKMSCPVPHIQPPDLDPPSLCCFTHKMAVTLRDPSASEEIRVKVRGHWTPLSVLVEHCGYTVDRRAGELLIAAPFINCGVTINDAKFTLSLQIGEKAVTLICPIPQPAEFPQTNRTLIDGPRHPITGTVTPVPDNLQPLLWAPPFYLAPAYYPHPSYPYKFPVPHSYDGNVPSTLKTTPPSQSQPAVTSMHQQIYQHGSAFQMRPSGAYAEFHKPQASLPRPGETKDSSQAASPSSPPEHYEATHPPSTGSVSTQAEAPALLPPRHTFSQYYHFYHHPKIPVNSGQFSQPMREAASPSQVQDAKLEPSQGDPYFSELYSYQHPYHLPHIPVGEIGGLDHPSRATVATKISPINPPTVGPSTSAHPPPNIPHYPIYVNYYNGNPFLPNPNYLSQPPQLQAPSQHVAQGPVVAPPGSPGEPHLYNSLKWVPGQLVSGDESVERQVELANRPSRPPSFAAFKHLPLKSSPNNNDGSGPVAVPPSAGQPSPTTPPPHPLHSYYHHPFYNYHNPYYGPERFEPADSPASPLSPEETSVPLSQIPDAPLRPRSSYSSYLPSHEVPLMGRIHSITSTPDKKDPEAMSSTTHSISDVKPLFPFNPFYYFDHYNWLGGYMGDQKPHPEASTHSERAPSGAEPQSFWDPAMKMNHPIFTTEEAYPSLPQPNFNSCAGPQHPNTDETEDCQDVFEAAVYTPSVSPFGLGPESNQDCSSLLGCCSYATNGCAMGQHFIFLIPNCVAKPTVSPPGHPSDSSDRSCTPQRMTSDPHLYAVPLDGCGVHTHMAGDVAVYRLEVQGTVYLQPDPNGMLKERPIRFMVECRSSPEYLHTMNFRVLNPTPVWPMLATVSVQTRIAKDESFTSYYAEPHLPLSLLRGRPVYVEVSLLNPPGPEWDLLVQYCLASTPYTSWGLIYDGCLSHDASQPRTALPTPPTRPRHTQRLTITSFLALPTRGPLHLENVENSHLDDLEVNLMCCTKVCPGGDGDCTFSCSGSDLNTLTNLKGCHSE